MRDLIIIGRQHIRILCLALLKAVEHFFHTFYFCFVFEILDAVLHAILYRQKESVLVLSLEQRGNLVTLNDEVVHQ